MIVCRVWIVLGTPTSSQEAWHPPLQLNHPCTIPRHITPCPASYRTAPHHTTPQPVRPRGPGRERLCRLCRLPQPRSRANSTTFVDRFFQLEEELGCLIDPVGFLARLPTPILDSINLSCDSKHVTSGISPSFCVFSLYTTHHGRPFFEALPKLAHACARWNTTRDSVREAANRCRSSEDHRPGVSQLPGIVTGDLNKVVNGYRCMTPATKPQQLSESPQTLKVAQPSSQRQRLRTVSKSSKSHPAMPGTYPQPIVPNAAVKSRHQHLPDTNIANVSESLDLSQPTVVPPSNPTANNICFQVEQGDNMNDSCYLSGATKVTELTEG
ncbi:hypothetical protein CDEST_12914 [Colletotrichum destructivum]|uniref:Uncharacterized protein n=1 Tax=Colletotrichum destructivum TaxID=34406 RepID=A0AAX4IXC7_9PEZI|nr:hypothetical protein CDEST_12914 [Colletotrichum destructivum]